MTGVQTCALPISKKAAKQGLVEAQRNLGFMYFDGKGVAQDYVKAHKWANLAAAQNNDTKLRDEIEEKMTREQIAEAQKLASEFVPKKE